MSRPRLQSVRKRGTIPVGRHHRIPPAFAISPQTRHHPHRMSHPRLRSVCKRGIIPVGHHHHHHHISKPCLQSVGKRGIIPVPHHHHHHHMSSPRLQSVRIRGIIPVRHHLQARCKRGNIPVDCHLREPRPRLQTARKRGAIPSIIIVTCDYIACPRVNHHDLMEMDVVYHRTITNRQF